MSKKVVFLFSKEEKPRLFESLSGNLASVFGEEILATAVDPDSVDLKSFKSGELFLPLRRDAVANYEGQIPSQAKLLFITRAISQNAFSQLLTITKGSSALVVNEDYGLAVETANFLFEMGLNDITWIPFDPQRPNWMRYNNISIAVTPNEGHLVPPFIREVINVGDRCIDTYSMVRIATILGLDSDEINSRLLQYSQSVAEPKSSIAKQYLDNFLKSSVLQHYVHTQTEGVLFCDQTNRLLYANEKANYIFGRDLQQNELTLSDVFSEHATQMMQENFTDDVIVIGNCNYSVRKNKIIMFGVNLGFSISLQDEKSIRDVERSLMRNLAKRGLQARASFQDIISTSPQMKECLDLAKKAAKTDFTVLIEGESGTGKELLAQAIHNGSPRSANPFVAINCAAMPESLLESELFGYEGGAFTGALRQGRAGLFEQANGGTLFLDEIGDMPAHLQALMLRVLQEKQILRVGGNQIIDVDVRIIAASNKRLSNEVAQKSFRADLYHRLNVIPLYIPPLRHRQGDIALLLKHFLGAEYTALSRQQREYLQQQSWSGNVRQLQNFSNYFRTTYKIEGFFHEYNTESPDEKPNVLALIKEHSTLGHGIGRNALLALCRDNHIYVSDAWLRKELLRLQEAGYISIGKGRSGCQITELGSEYLTDVE